MEEFKAVYKITDGNGNFYIGSSKDPKYRFRDHKKRKYAGLDYKTAKIEVICYTKNFCNLEENLIKKELDKKNPFCKNKHYGCFGPKGYKFSDERRKKQSENLKKRWKDPEQIKMFLIGRENSHKQNRYKEMSLKSHKLRWSKMKKYFAKNKETGVVMGPYQGYLIATKELNLHKSTIDKCLNKNQTNKKYHFFYEENNKCLA